MNNYITIEASIAYCVDALLTFKEQTDNKKDTYEELAKEIIKTMNKYSPSAICTKVKEMYKMSIKNNRKISRKLSVSYSVLSYNKLNQSANKDNITCKDFSEEIVVMINLYSPVIAIKKADLLLNTID